MVNAKFGTDPDGLATALLSAPQTFSVTTGGDDGAGSLRAALSASRDGDQIVFDPALAQVAIATPLVVASDITIDGAQGRAGLANIDLAGTSQWSMNGSDTIGNVTIGGSLTLRNDGTLTQSGTLVLGDGAGGTAQIVNGPNGTWGVAGDFGIASGAGTPPTFVNQGTLTKTGGFGVSHFAMNMVDTGTLSVPGGNLRFDGLQNSFAGTYVGPGMIDYGLGSTSVLGTIAMIAGACSTDFGTVQQAGTVTVGDGSTIKTLPGSSWSFVGDAGLALAAGSSWPVFNNLGLLAKTGGVGTTVIGIDVVDTGTIAVASGTLSFRGPSNSFAGSIGGAGTFSIGGGGVATIQAGTTIGTSAFSLIGGGTSVSLGGAVSYAGSFSQVNATTLNLGGNTLAVSGSAFFGPGAKGAPTVTGSSGGALAISGTASLGALTLGGAAVLRDTGTVSATGTLILGDANNQTAKLTVQTNGVYALGGDVGIASGGVGALINLGGGKLLKNIGTGLSVVAPAIVGNNAAATGSVRVGSGTLRLDGPVSGNILLKAAGGTLILSQAVASSVSAIFTGPKATLCLADAQDFHGTIAGFAGGETIDLRSIAFGSAPSITPAYAGTASGGTLTVSDGLHTAVLSMLGSYTAANFHGASDNHGGTAITFV